MQEGQTVLHIAVRVGSLEALKLLAAVDDSSAVCETLDKVGGLCILYTLPGSHAFPDIASQCTFLPACMLGEVYIYKRFWLNCVYVYVL